MFVYLYKNIKAMVFARFGIIVTLLTKTILKNVYQVRHPELVSGSIE